MVAPIATNQYKFPAGYAKLPSAVLSKYSVWNGFVSAFNPAASQFGGVQTLTVTAAPADLSTMTLFGPDGKTYLFQFVYNSSVQTQGIKIPLPASGGSTAAQVATQILSVMSLASGTTFGGTVVLFPWIAQQTGANQVTVNWTTPGAITGFVAPAGITIVTTGQFGFGSAQVVPAKVGPLGMFMPGV